MSPPFADVSRSEWLTVITANQLENYFLIVAGVIPLWDHAVTLAEEIEVIWQRKWSWLTGLYCFNRLLGTWFALSMLLPVANWATLMGCEAVTVFNMIPMLLLDLVWATFSALRVYAVGGEATRMAVLVFVLSLAPFVIDLAAYATTIFVDISFTSWVSLCAEDSRASVPVFDILMFVGRIPLIIADTLVLLVTWRTTFRLRKQAAAINMQTPLTTMLLRDGTFYFVSALNVNAFQMVLFLYSDRYPIASYFVPIVTPVIVSRFLLNLRSLRDDGTNATAANHSRTMADPASFSLHFAANMAAETNGTCGIGAYPESEDSLYFAAAGSTTEWSGSGGFDQVQEMGMETFAESVVTELSRIS